MLYKTIHILVEIFLKIRLIILLFLADFFLMLEDSDWLINTIRIIAIVRSFVPKKVIDRLTLYLLLQLSKFIMKVPY